LKFVAAFDRLGKVVAVEGVPKSFQAFKQQLIRPIELLVRALKL
jgi:hypothetical protein